MLQTLFLEPVVLRLNREDWCWVKGRGGLSYIQQRLLSGGCLVQAIGEISSETLGALRAWVPPAPHDALVESVAEQTRVITWGEEGVIRHRFSLHRLPTSRLVFLQDLCFRSGREIHEVIKALVLAERGYRLYQSLIPHNNRLAIVHLRQVLRQHGPLPWVYWLMYKLSGVTYDW